MNILLVWKSNCCHCLPTTTTKKETQSLNLHKCDNVMLHAKKKSLIFEYPPLFLTFWHRLLYLCIFFSRVDDVDFFFMFCLNHFLLFPFPFLLVPLIAQSRYYSLYVVRHFGVPSCRPLNSPLLSLVDTLSLWPAPASPLCPPPLSLELNSN